MRQEGEHGRVHESEAGEEVGPDTDFEKFENLKRKKKWINFFKDFQGF